MSHIDLAPFVAGKPFQLNDHGASDHKGCLLEKNEAKNHLLTLAEALSLLQTRLFAEGTRSLLIVLQGMDTSGKDGTIKNVFSLTSPLGLKIANFRAPNDVERNHDYLWRVHKELPERGKIGVFNRSHYGDVIAARVENIISEESCKKRYRHINDFEKMLTDEGTTILKFFLNIGPDEQRDRLQERIENKEKHWKFSENDLKTRAKWHQYLSAYEAALDATNTAFAPWIVVPANRKWFRNVIVAQAIVDKLEEMDPRPPVFDFHKQDIQIPKI